MSEPKRWTDEAPPELIGRLIDAASHEQPPEGSLSRSLSRVGLAAGAAGTVATTGAASSASTVAAKATLATVAPWLKWTVLAGVVGTTGGAWVATRAPEPKIAHAARPVPAPTPPRAAPAPAHDAPRGAPSLPSAEPTAEPASPPAPAVPVAPRKREVERAEPPLDAERLAEEVRAVDAARALVAAGRASDALAALDDYEREFAIRRFAPEALYLRMEAELTAGRQGAARETATRLLSRYPKSPQAPRARQVLGETNP